MAANVDQSLDDLVAANRPKGIRRSVRRGGAKGQVLGSQPSNPATRVKAAPTSNGAKIASAAAIQTTEKIIVSGLPPDVTENQVKELFHTTVGPLRQVNLHYDSQGRSKGVAEVIFQKRGHGNEAQQQYNNRLIDGKKRMKIELVVEPSRAATAATSLVSRVAPAPAVANNNTPAPRSGGRGRRGTRGGRRKGTDRPPKSAADLDAEMEDYTTANNAPAEPAPAAA